jgi:hypothetical protein
MTISSWLKLNAQISRRHAMAFPNQSRSYNENKHCVRFWGHDGTSEIAFDLAEGLLVGPNGRPAEHHEASILKMFDANRPKIEKLAQSAHASESLRYHLLS